MSAAVSPATKAGVKSVVRHAIVAFVATFLTFAPGIMAAPNFSDQKAAVIGAIVAGVAAAARAVSLVAPSLR